MTRLLETDWRHQDVFSLRKNLIFLGISQDDIECRSYTQLVFKGKRVVRIFDGNKNMTIQIEGSDSKEVQELMNGFSQLVKCNSFCKYNLKIAIDGSPSPISFCVYEWDVNPEERFGLLCKEPNVTKLVRLAA